MQPSTNNNQMEYDVTT